MKHAIVAERFGVRLRPVAPEDAEFIFRLRRSPELSKYIGAFDPRYSVHLAWLERYFARENDYYFIIELRSGRPVGTIAVYDIADGVGNWGRWIISPSVPAAPASVWLIFRVAFDMLGLSGVYSNTVADNKSVVSFHDSCGLPRTGIQRGGLTVDGIAYDMIIHTAAREGWPRIRHKLEKPAALAERLLLEDAD